MASSRLERIGTIFTRVEGLITRQAMKPDDRPLWFDVYKAFPPRVEPKYAQPKPENCEIRPIFYQEDIVRAKFHSKGYGLSAVNMSSASRDTQTRRLIQQYEKLKSQISSEDELIEKCAAAIASEKHVEIPSQNRKSNATVTSQILSEVKLKDIFNENEK